MNYIDDIIIIKRILENHRFLLVLVPSVLLGLIILLCIFIYLLKKNLKRVDQLNRQIIQEEEQLQKTLDQYVYLSNHDSLTGLYNRRYLDEKLVEIDILENLPISIISGDVNGLKQTNDIFGHEEGDLLIRTAADVMVNVCREEDIIIRTGGDEFLIIFPKTGKSTVERIAYDIKSQLSSMPSNSFNYNISLGFDTKIDTEEDIELIIKNADHNMYTAKVLDWKKFNKEIISTLFKNFMSTYPKERIHARNVSKLCRRMGERLKLSEAEIMSLREAGFMHDIGKITLDEELVNKVVPLNNYELQTMKHHPVVGYRILNSSDFTVDIANYVLCHHEQWNGSGYPKGLKGKEIPLISRIVSIADQYDFLMRTTTYKKGYSQQETMEILKSYKGERLDPELVDEFIVMINEDKAKYRENVMESSIKSPGSNE